MNNRKRQIIVTLRHEEDAKFLHSYKFGRKSENEVENMWINPGLAGTEKETDFF